MRLKTDNNLGQISFKLVVLLLLFVADNVNGDKSSSLVSRRLFVINVRRIITKQIVDTAKMIISGKIKRKIRIALELSRLKIIKNMFTKEIVYVYNIPF